MPHRKRRLGVFGELRGLSGLLKSYISRLNISLHTAMLHIPMRENHNNQASTKAVILVSDEIIAIDDN